MRAGSRARPGGFPDPARMRCASRAIGANLERTGPHVGVGSDGVRRRSYIPCPARRAAPAARPPARRTQCHAQARAPQGPTARGAGRRQARPRPAVETCSRVCTIIGRGTCRLLQRRARSKPQMAGYAHAAHRCQHRHAIVVAAPLPDVTAVARMALQVELVDEAGSARAHQCRQHYEFGPLLCARMAQSAERRERQQPASRAGGQ